MTRTPSPSRADLLRACAQRVGSALDDKDEQALRAWWHEERAWSAPLAEAILARPDVEWDKAIFEHPAHRHAWYDALADKVSIADYAAFLLENSAFPPFLAMVEKTHLAQICDEGRAAVQRNIDDEQVPVPHADLMRRLVQAVKARAGDVALGTYPSLIDRTLVFYYGYFCDPWHLVGSLCAMELLAVERLTSMGAGLRRLGLDPVDLEFIDLHLACDEGHAREWIEDVIIPSVAQEPRLRRPVAEGIASCLATSERYLDDLCARLSRPDPRRVPEGAA